jgi:hypothetical protein
MAVEVVDSWWIEGAWKRLVGLVYVERACCMVGMIQ